MLVILMNLTKGLSDVSDLVELNIFSDLIRLSRTPNVSIREK